MFTPFFLLRSIESYNRHVSQEMSYTNVKREGNCPGGGMSGGEYVRENMTSGKGPALMLAVDGPAE